jgi:flagellar basal body-associated protein FliL
VIADGKMIIIPIALGSILIALAMIIGAWLVTSGRKGMTALNKDRQYGQLAEEYRRLSEMAVTTQEHTDLKLEEIQTGIAQLRGQLDAVQKILKDVE